MRMVLGLGISLLIVGCSSNTIIYAGGDGGPGADSSTTDDGSPADDGATGDVSVPVEAGPPDRSKCKVDPDKIGLTTRTFAGAPDYTVYVPTTYDMNVPSALVEVLHGAGDTTPNYINVWKGVADMRNAILLAPEASSPLGSGFTWSTGDETFVLGELDDLAHCYSIDPKRRILHGYSAGGIMAYLFGLKDAAKFSGIAIFSADEGTAEYYNGGSLLPSSWLIPVSHFHGMSDANFPIASAKAGIDKLTAAGHPTFWHPIPGDHGSTPTPANALTEFDDLKSFTAP
jgi:poly(3-hydroxybutyrate) depolymerase